MCIKFVNYNVMINGDGVGRPITPKSGLRQGDLLSPSSFILCMEAFSSLLRKAKGCGDIHVVKVCRGTPLLLHLLFIDEYYLLFCRAMNKEVETLQGILSTFEKSPRLATNFQKLEIFFNKNTP